MLAKLSVKDILLLDHGTWDRWYENIQGSLPDYLWKHLDQNNDVIFVDSVAPVEPVIKPLPEIRPPIPSPTTRNILQKETPEQQASCESRYKEDIDIYFKRYTIYRDTKNEWKYYHAIRLSYKIKSRPQ